MLHSTHPNRPSLFPLPPVIISPMSSSSGWRRSLYGSVAYLPVPLFFLRLPASFARALSLSPSSTLSYFLRLSSPFGRIPLGVMPRLVQNSTVFAALFSFSLCSSLVVSFAAVLGALLRRLRRQPLSRLFARPRCLHQHRRFHYVRFFGCRSLQYAWRRRRRASAADLFLLM